MFKTARLNPVPKVRREKVGYIGAPKVFALELACQHLWQAFCCKDSAKFAGIYVVGSCLERADWRDVDLVCILDDAAFGVLFPGIDPELYSCGSWEHDPRWLVMVTAISAMLSEQTGLPIDFKFQPMSQANERHHGRRNAVGLFLSRP